MGIVKGSWVAYKIKDCSRTDIRIGTCDEYNTLLYSPKMKPTLKRKGARGRGGPTTAAVAAAARKINHTVGTV